MSHVLGFEHQLHHVFQCWLNALHAEQRQAPFEGSHPLGGNLSGFLLSNWPFPLLLLPLPRPLDFPFLPPFPKLSLPPPAGEPLGVPLGAPFPLGAPLPDPWAKAVRAPVKASASAWYEDASGEGSVVGGPVLFFFLGGLGGGASLSSAVLTCV